ncbi:MAG: hypothetical protein RLZZ70_127 [Candidatus Parcubacteria bacterium]|jgi:hypothetical protein
MRLFTRFETQKKGSIMLPANPKNDLPFTNRGDGGDYQKRTCHLSVFWH